MARRKSFVEIANEIPDSSCTCEKCIDMCNRRPCWGTPSDIERIIESGFIDHLMREYWATKNGNLYMIVPAIVGFELRTSPYWLRVKNRCSLLDSNNRCKINHIKPIEGRKAICLDNTKYNIQIDRLHMNIYRTWDTKFGSKVLKIWEDYVNADQA